VARHEEWQGAVNLCNREARPIAANIAKLPELLGAEPKPGANATAGLHKAIGRWLISLQKPLNGAELRFVRLEMETTQRDLAAFIGTSEQTLRLWEKKPLPTAGGAPGSADRLLRAIYAEYIGGDGTVRRMVDRLSQLNQIETAEANFRETTRGWKPRATPDLDQRKCRRQ
jgi:putative transcriptional regulator